MFLFVNNILKSSSTARARQIFENEIAFKNLINSDFKSIDAEDFLFSKIIKNENNSLRKFFFHFYFIIKVIFINRKGIVYSRNLSVVYLANKMGFSSVWEAHDLPKGINITFLKAIINNCKIISISKALGDKICEVYKIKQNAVFIAHDGVDIKAYDSLRNIDTTIIRKKYNIPIDKKVILHSGSIMQERGASLFKDVLINLPDWFFVQVGGKNKDIEFLKKDLTSFSNYIIIPHQEVEELIKLQFSCDALFYMITKETKTYWCCSPMKIFEYLATGRPIVASNIGSLNEILTKDVAYLYNPEDKDSLQNALLKLNSINESSVISKNAVELVRQKFTWNLRAQLILNFLEFKN
jgi:glycosyltransferase involved in cell wall biosynthesis